MLFRIPRSWPIIDASAVPGGVLAAGGGLELRVVGRRDGAGVVPGVESGGRVELLVSADNSISESVPIGDRCRSSSAT